MEMEAVDHDPFMVSTQAVDHDPFAPGFEAVDHDPFAVGFEAVSHDPFSGMAQPLTGFHGALIDPTDLAECEKNYRILDKYRDLPISENVHDRRDEWRFGPPALQRMYEDVRDTVTQAGRDLLNNPLSFPDVPENEFNQNVPEAVRLDQRNRR